MATWNWIWQDIEGDTAKRAALIDAASYLEPGVIRFAGGLWVNGTGWDRANTAPTNGNWTFTDPNTLQTYNYSHTYKPAMIDSYADFAAQLGAETIMQVNVCDQNPAMWADLLTYTNIEHSYDFRFWELGNEIDLEPCLTSAEYAQVFVTYEAALKAVDPTIQVVGPVPTQPYRFSGEGNNQWLADLDAVKGDDLDGLFWHWYPMTASWPETNTNTFEYQAASIPALLSHSRNVGTACQDGFGCPGEVMPDLNRLNRMFYRRGIAEAMKNVVIDPLRATNPDLITGITEMGPHASAHTIPVNSNQTGAVWLADMLGRWAYNGLDLLTYYTLEEGDPTHSRSLIGITGSTSMNVRPNYYTEFMYSQYFGDMMVLSDTDDPDKQVVAWASRDTQDPSVLKLMLVNLHTEAATANVQVNGFSPVWGESYLMSSADPLNQDDQGSFNDHTSTINGVTIPDYTIANPSLFQNAVASISPVNIATGQSISYEMPALSVVALTLHNDGTPPATTPTPVVQPTATPTPVVQPTATPVVPTATPGGSTPPPASGTVSPAKIDLNIGESSVFTLANGSTRTVKLLGYNVLIARQLIEATVEVSGGGKTEQHALRVGFGGSPVVVNGLRIYGYAWKEANGSGFEDVGLQGGFPLTSGKDAGFAVNDASFTLFPNMEGLVYPFGNAFHEGGFLQTFLDPDGWAHSGFDVGVHANVPVLAPHDGYVWYTWYGGQGMVWVTETNNQWASPCRIFTHIDAGSDLVGHGSFVTAGTPIVSSVWRPAGVAYDHFHAGSCGSEDFGSWIFYQEIWNYQHRNDFAAPRYWLGLGAYSGGLSSNHIAQDESGDISASLQPRAGVTDINGSEAWKLADNLVNSAVRVGEVLSDAPFSGNGDRLGQNSVGYVATYIFSETDRTAPGQAHLKLGLSRGAHIWLNGQTVFNGTEARYDTYNTASESPLVIDKYDINLPLQKGWNTLIIKSDHGTKGVWLVSPKIGDSAGNPLPGVHFSLRDTALQATPVGGGQVQLSWSAVDFHATAANSYLIDVATDAGFTNIVHNGLNVGNVTSYTAGGLADGVQYHFRVRPYNTADLGGTAYLRHADTASATAQGIENYPISPAIPGGLAAQDTPVFVLLGSDDNHQANGINWFVNELLAGRTNPAGSGSPATLDGTPARMSFYMMGVLEGYGNGVAAATRNAYDQGNELGNHAYGGFDGGLGSQQAWRDSLSKTNTFLTRPVGGDGTIVTSPGGQQVTATGIGMPVSEIYGFRTPLDQYNNDLFPVLQELGFIYHASSAQGHTSQSADASTDLYWPGTLQSGIPYSNAQSGVGSMPATPGLWEIAQNYLRLPPSMGGGNLGYCDKDWFFTFGGDAPDVMADKMIEILKYNLDLHIQGNRTPLHLCLHSQEWDMQDWQSGPRSATNLAKQRILSEFLDYALAQPEVRVGRQIDVINWVRNPVALGASLTCPPKADPG